MIGFGLAFKRMRHVKGCNVAPGLSLLVEGWAANRYADDQSGGLRAASLALQTPHPDANPSRQAPPPFRWEALSLTKWVLPALRPYTGAEGAARVRVLDFFGGVDSCSGFGYG